MLLFFRGQPLYEDCHRKHTLCTTFQIHSALWQHKKSAIHLVSLIRGQVASDWLQTQFSLSVFQRTSSGLPPTSQCSWLTSSLTYL